MAFSMFRRQNKGIHMTKTCTEDQCMYGLVRQKINPQWFSQLLWWIFLDVLSSWSHVLVLQYCNIDCATYSYLQKLYNHCTVIWDLPTCWLCIIALYVTNKPTIIKMPLMVNKISVILHSVSEVLFLLSCCVL